jgi:hypothetical protein
MTFPLKCTKCGRRLKLRGHPETCFCQTSCYNCHYSFGCNMYNEIDHECRVKLWI